MFLSWFKTVLLISSRNPQQLFLHTSHQDNISIMSISSKASNYIMQQVWSWLQLFVTANYQLFEFPRKYSCLLLLLLWLPFNLVLAVINTDSLKCFPCLPETIWWDLIIGKFVTLVQDYKVAEAWNTKSSPREDAKFVKFW